MFAATSPTQVRIGSAALRLCGSAALRANLFFGKPRHFLRNLESNESFWFRSVSLATVFCVILVSGCGPRAGRAEHCSPNQAPGAPPTLLQPSVARIDLGTVERGGHRETTVYLYNSGTKTVEVTHIYTSCDCFEVKLDKMIVPPGERVRTTLKIDFAHEPNFVGELGLRAEGVAKAENEMAFVLSVEVKVK